MTTPRQTYPDPACDRTAEEREDAACVLLPVAAGLWLGNATAAGDAVALGRAGITQTLCLAVNLDMPPMALADGTVLRRAKVGLIDGPGNTAAHLVSAVLSISGMQAQVAPGKPGYPDHRPGGLLVHCRGGRSRSVVALALHLSEVVGAAPFDDVLGRLRALRGLPPTQPNAALCALAGQVRAAMILRSAALAP